MLKILIIGNRFAGTRNVASFVQACGYDTSDSYYFNEAGVIDFSRVFEVDDHVAEHSPYFPMWFFTEGAKNFIFANAVIDVPIVINVVAQPMYAIAGFVEAKPVLSEAERAFLMPFGWEPRKRWIEAAAIYHLAVSRACHAVVSTCDLSIQCNAVHFTISEVARKMLYETLARCVSTLVDTCPVGVPMGHPKKTVRKEQLSRYADDTVHRFIMEQQDDFEAWSL